VKNMGGTPLGSVPQDLWPQALCTITSGPYCGLHGRVVRWGNGWVTVNCREGIHNRHAFELVVANGENGEGEDHWPPVPDDMDIFMPKPKAKPVENMTTPTEVSE